MSDFSFITDPSRWREITPEMYDEINDQIERTFAEGCHGNCEACDSDCDQRRTNELPRFAKRMYAVNGSRGGAGKSSITVLLAGALTRMGLKVGILDCDIYTATIPHLTGLDGLVHQTKEQKLIPAKTASGIEVMSMDLTRVERMEPVLYTGLDAYKLTDFFYQSTVWGELDVMLVDMPSGCGDIPLNLYTTLPLNGAIAVTNPGSLSVEAVQRNINLGMMLMTPTVAYVENKSFAPEPISAEAYVLPRGCITVAVPLSGDIAALGDEGTLEELECPELQPVVDLIAAAVRVSDTPKPKTQE